jgi:hypothetical protein
MIQKILTFLKSTFSEPDGTGSATRVLGGAVVASTIIWVSYLVIKTHTLPDLTSPSLFVGAGFSGYGMNKLSCAFKRNDDKQ